MDKLITIATDNEIDLKVPINIVNECEYIDIYLHDTDINVGIIWYDSSDDFEFIQYFGNVGYEIKKEYRGNNYALKALKLLKQILIDKKMENMLFSIELDNVASIKTVEKFGASKLGIKKVLPNPKLYALSDKPMVMYNYNLNGGKSK